MTDTNQDAGLVAELRRRDQSYSLTLGDVRLPRKTLECRAADAIERLSAPLEVNVREKILTALFESRRNGLFGMSEREACEHMADAIEAALTERKA